MLFTVFWCILRGFDIRWVAQLKGLRPTSYPAVVRRVSSPETSAAALHLRVCLAGAGVEGFPGSGKPNGSAQSRNVRARPGHGQSLISLSPTSTTSAPSPALAALARGAAVPCAVAASCPRSSSCCATTHATGAATRSCLKHGGDRPTPNPGQQARTWRQDARLTLSARSAGRGGSRRRCTIQT